MDKRIIHAIALSLLVLLAFDYFTRKPAENSSMVQHVQPSATPEEHPVAPGTESNIKSINKDSYDNIENDRELVYRRDRYEVTFSEKGGYIKKLNYLLELNTQMNEFNIFDVKHFQDGVMRMREVAYTGNYEPILYTGRLTPEGAVFEYNSSGLAIEKTYHFNDINHTVLVDYVFTNKGSSPNTLSFNLLCASDIAEENKLDARYIEAKVKINGKVKHTNKPKKKRMSFYGDLDWLSLQNKFFSFSMKVDQSSKYAYIDESEQGGLQIGLKEKNIQLSPGAPVTLRYVAYIGPNRAEDITNSGLNIEDTISYGFFSSISIFLLNVLTYFNSVTHNWGLAIILLTLVINVLMLPLTKKSFIAMQKMQALQPKMEKIRRDHKSNPQRMNKEIGALYKEYHVNPLGGCLPMLAQFPILIALYQGLLRFVELKGAKFLWITDLSQPDRIPIPFSLPLTGNEIHLLPLLMAGFMFLQQKISMGTNRKSLSPEQVQQQKIMLILLPIMFGFMFYNFSSGLVLYWLTSTVLTTTEHAYFRKKAQLIPSPS